jgi:RNA polymerase sigma factor (sigma-70 family)
MSVFANSSACRELDRLFRDGTEVAWRDGELLERFFRHRDAAAFESLLVRHGPMVMGVCRRVLRHRHDVEDAFQATFLVLVRKGQELRDANRLAPWLYGVAVKVALKAHSRRVRQSARERVLDSESEAAMNHRTDAARDLAIELYSKLDEALAGLPRGQRDALVLCLVQGLSIEDAAVRLRCPTGTVKSRLARGRDALRSRLEKRGIAPTLAAVSLSAQGRESLAGHVSQELLQQTLQVALSCAGAGATASAGLVVSHSISELTRGATTTMTLSKWTLVIAGASCLGLGVVAAGALLPQDAGAGGSAAAATRAENRFNPVSPAAANYANDRDRVTLTNNLKMLGLAFHNYVDTHKEMPRFAIYGPDGTPKLSWRVALLPYLDQEGLYRQFHLDEAWDSPHNRSLIERMPRVFATPGIPTNPGETKYRAFLGRGAAFEGEKSIGFADVIDGTSNTILFAVAAEPVIWTRPEGIPFAHPPRIEVGNVTDDFQLIVPGRILFSLMDGSVRELGLDSFDGADNAEGFLRQAITRNGGDAMDWPQERRVAGEGAADAGTGSAARFDSPTAPGAAIASSGSTSPRFDPESRPAPSGAATRGGSSIGEVGGAAGAMMMGGPGIPPDRLPPALAERLNQLEAKMDRILRLLETHTTSTIPGRTEGGGTVAPARP